MPREPALRGDRLVESFPYRWQADLALKAYVTAMCSNPEILAMGYGCYVAHNGAAGWCVMIGPINEPRQVGSHPKAPARPHRRR